MFVFFFFEWMLPKIVWKSSFWVITVATFIKSDGFYSLGSSSQIYVLFLIIMPLIADYLLFCLLLFPLMITQPAMEPGIVPLRVPVASLSTLVCHKAAGFFSHPSTKYALQNCLTKILHDMVAFYSQQPKTYMTIVSIHGSTTEGRLLLFYRLFWRMLLHWYMISRCWRYWPTTWFIHSFHKF